MNPLERFLASLAMFTFAFLILFLVFGVLLSRPCRADEPPKAPTCQEVLSACDRDVEKLKAQVVILKDDNKFWKGQAQTNRGADTFLLSVALGATAGALGGAAANGRTGLAPGGIVGVLTGTIVGLIAR